MTGITLSRFTVYVYYIDNHILLFCMLKSFVSSDSVLKVDFLLLICQDIHWCFVISTCQVHSLYGQKIRHSPSSFSSILPQDDNTRAALKCKITPSCILLIYHLLSPKYRFLKRSQSFLDSFSPSRKQENHNIPFNIQKFFSSSRRVRNTWEWKRTLTIAGWNGPTFGESDGRRPCERGYIYTFTTSLSL